MTTGLQDKKLLDPQKISLSSITHCRPIDRKRVIYPPDLSPQNVFPIYAHTRTKKCLCQSNQSCREVIPVGLSSGRNEVWPLETGYLRKATQQERKSISTACSKITKEINRWKCCWWGEWHFAGAKGNVSDKLRRLTVNYCHERAGSHRSDCGQLWAR